MNKNSTLFLMLIACNTALAGNYYAGINLGINTVNVDKNLTYPLGGEPLTHFQYDPGYNGFHGQLFVGTGFAVSTHLNLLIQGDADLFTGTAKNTITNWFFTNSASTKEKLTYGFGLFLLPEYQYSDDFKVFIGPGLVYSNFSTKSGFTGGNIGVTGDFSSWLTGWAIKTGISKRINNNLDFLLTYQYDQYGSMTRANVEPLSGDSLQGTYKPEANLFSVGIRYLFGNEPMHDEK